MTNPTKIHLTFLTDASGSVLIDKASPEPFMGSEEFVRAQGWHGMDSAPMDGKPLLLFARCKTATAPIQLVGWYITGMGWIECSFTTPVGIVPYAWKPLDLPPSPFEKGVG